MNRRGFSVFLLFVLVGCSRPAAPDGNETDLSVPHDGSLRIAALDYSVGDLSDPAVLEKFARADILIVQCAEFWGKDYYEGKLQLIRDAKPDIKILGYFRSKAVKVFWGDEPRESHTYNYDLYAASRPYWSMTTTGDTLMDWPGAVVYDFTNPEARRAMLGVFADYQNNSNNKFDGIFWDYFNDELWIAPSVSGMTGDPDMDRDGVPHFEDPDELQAFQDAEIDWVNETRQMFGNQFIQIANGARALTDSSFASYFDGMFYEIFPNVGFGRNTPFLNALDLNQPNNLWAAQHWPRVDNGGPWLILSHAKPVGSFQDAEGNWASVDPGNLLRVVSRLTGGTSIHYNMSGLFRAAIPELELNLGPPLAPATISNSRITRRFENGRVELVLGTGVFPVPFDYVVHSGGVDVEVFGDINRNP